MDHLAILKTKYANHALLWLLKPDVALDCWYARNWSLWYDLVILLKTVRVVLARKGAY